MGRYIKNLGKDRDIEADNAFDKENGLDNENINPLFSDAELSEKVRCEIDSECKKETYGTLLKKGTESFLKSLLKTIKGKDLL